MRVHSTLSLLKYKMISLAVLQPLSIAKVNILGFTDRYIIASILRGPLFVDTLHDAASFRRLTFQ